MSSPDSPPPGPIEVKLLPLESVECKVLKIDEAEGMPPCPKLEHADLSPFELFKERMTMEILAQQKAKNSQIISEAKACKIIQYLRWKKNPADFPNLKLSDFGRHTIREYTSSKRMVLIDVPDLDLYNVLAVPKKAELDKCVAFSDYRRVVHAGEMFAVVHHLHIDSTSDSHYGYRPIYDRSKHEYFGIPRSYIRLHCKYCPGCVVRLPASKPQQQFSKQPASSNLDKRVFLVKEFYLCGGSIDRVLTCYQEEFGGHDLPRPQTIQYLVRLFEETGSVMSPKQAHLSTLPLPQIEDMKPPLDSGS